MFSQCGPNNYPFYGRDGRMSIFPNLQFAEGTLLMRFYQFSPGAMRICHETKTAIREHLKTMPQPPQVTSDLLPYTTFRERNELRAGQT